MTVHFSHLVPHHHSGTDLPSAGHAPCSSRRMPPPHAGPSPATRRLQLQDQCYHSAFPIFAIPDPMPSFVTVALLVNVAVESLFGAWLMVSPATVPDFPGASPASEGALTSRRMYSSAILALSAAAIRGHVSGRPTDALVAFAVLHSCLVATFLLAKPAGQPEQVGAGVHFALGVMSLIAAHRSSDSNTSAKLK